jgi:hypothetical protein
MSGGVGRAACLVSTFASRDAGRARASRVEPGSAYIGKTLDEDISVAGLLAGRGDVPAKAAKPLERGL